MLARVDLAACATLAATVVIEVFTNDPGAGISTGTASANLTAIVQTLQRMGATAIIMVTPYSTNSTTDAALDPYRTVGRNVAAATGARVFDTYTELSSLSPTDKTNDYYQGDGLGIHFAAAGNTEITSLAAGAHSAAFAH
jgi:negative regulator of sigma E activity